LAPPCKRLSDATANYGAAPTFAPSAEAIQDAKIAVADFSASNGHDMSALLVVRLFDLSGAAEAKSPRPVIARRH
jgi:hypothetical protein